LKEKRLMRVFASDLQFPEGPVWVGDGSVLVVEIRRRTLTRCFPDGRKQYYELGGGPNGAAMGLDGYCYVANNGGFSFKQRGDGAWVTSGTAEDYKTGRIERVNLETGKWEVLYDKVDGHNIRGPNDLVMDAHGGFWFTDPGKTRHRDWDRGSVCYAKCDGSLVKEMIFPIHKPNGIGLSPTGRRSTSPRPRPRDCGRGILSGPGRARQACDRIAELAARQPARVRLTDVPALRFARCRSQRQRLRRHPRSRRRHVIDPKTGSAEFVPVPGTRIARTSAFGGPGCARRTSRSRTSGT
jgi:gluconolactonase